MISTASVLGSKEYAAVLEIVSDEKMSSKVFLNPIFDLNRITSHILLRLNCEGTEMIAPKLGAV